MSNRKRATRGFTLVELLVVISIIGMLMSLLLPAVQSARESGRRNTCLNNAKQIVTAMHSFENAKKYFPGYANPFQTVPVTPPTPPATAPILRVSYLIPLLPMMEKSDIYTQLLYGTGLNTTGSNPNSNVGIVYQKLLSCPSNPPVGQDPKTLAYVVNGGFDNVVPPSATKATPKQFLAASGVCFDLAQTAASANAPTTAWTPETWPVKTGLDYLSTKDGSTYTLLVSENIQAYDWLSALRPSLTFLWGKEVIPTLATAPLAINQDKTFPPPTDTAGGNIHHARPSSNHVGGVVVGFCDGHMTFLGEEVDYGVYKQLMTPHGLYIYQNGADSSQINPPFVNPDEIAPHSLPLDDTKY